MLNVEDMDKACAFYGNVMGLPLKFRQENMWAAFDAGGVTLALAGQAEKAQNPVALNFKVENVADATNTAVAGGAILMAPEKKGGHEIRATVKDTNGHLINFYSPAPKA
jgi:predicted enzyme related to lactoylglutathione lyase